MADPKRLYGLKALVLNGGAGIGEATARRFAEVDDVMRKPAM